MLMLLFTIIIIALNNCLSRLRISSSRLELMVEGELMGVVYHLESGD